MGRYMAGAAMAAALVGFSAAGAATINFENYVDATNNEVAQNFDQISGSLSAAQSTNGAANDYLRVTSTSTGTQRATLVYDTTPADHATTKSMFHLTPGGPGLTVSADVRLTAFSASYGVYIVNSDRTKAFLALFNVNTTSGNEATDKIRFTAPTSSGWNPTDNSPTETGLSLTTDNGADAGFAQNEFKNISVTYSIDASNHAILSMTAGTRTLTSAPITGTSAFGDVEVAMRLSPTTSGQTVDMDNLSIVPEPASLGILGLAGLVLARRRQA